MKARNSMSDRLRLTYQIYLEPVLATACMKMASEGKTKTRSKYIRYAVIRALIADGYPLAEVSEKFKPFIDKELKKHVS